MSNSPHNISHEEIVELQEKFVEMERTINNFIADMMTLTEMSQGRDDYSEKLAGTVLTKAPQIVSSLLEFTKALNEKAGPALQEKFSEIKSAIFNALAVMMARADRWRRADSIKKSGPLATDIETRLLLSNMSRGVDYSEKLTSTVLTKAPLILSSLQQLTQASNEKAGPKPEVGQG
jgi:hypothetical protein